MKNTLSDFLGIMFGSIFLSYAMKYDNIILLLIGAYLWYIIGFYSGRKYEKEINHEQ